MENRRKFAGWTIALSWLAMAACDKSSCVNMHIFDQTYKSLQESVGALQTQMRMMKSSLDATILSSCGQGTTYVPVPAFNLTYCDFEKGKFCNFTQDKDDNGDWRLETGHPDHTFGTNIGTRAWYGNSGYHARITSAVFYKASAMCVRLYYMGTVATDHLQVFVKVIALLQFMKCSGGLVVKAQLLVPGYMYREIRAWLSDNKLAVLSQAGAGHGYPILDLTGLPKDWTQAEVQVDPEYLGTDVQLQYEAWGSGYIYIDDMSVYNVNCATPGIRTPPCSGGNYTMTNGTTTSCYTFHIEPRTWREAVLACKKEWPDATLVAIETAAEQSYLVNAIKTSHAFSQSGQFGYWTTGNDQLTEGTFTWSGQFKALTYTNWHAGQPNNVGGNQDCLLLQYDQNNYEWGDVDCAERHPFICESTYKRF